MRVGRRGEDVIELGPKWLRGGPQPYNKLWTRYERRGVKEGGRKEDEAKREKGDVGEEEGGEAGGAGG